MFRARVTHHGTITLLLLRLMAVLALAGCGSAASHSFPPPGSSTPTSTSQERPSPEPTPTATPQSSREVAETREWEVASAQEPPWDALFDPAIGLRDGPVPVPLELSIPGIEVEAPVLGVGITNDNAMDAPGGPEGDPNYETVFWYRGGGRPGDVGTATIAGHVTGRVGEPAVFWRLEELEEGDSIIVDNTNTAERHTFVVIETQLYPVEEAKDPSVLARIYGMGPVAGVGPVPSPDGLAHLTLITCGGEWNENGFDHRRVVYAVRVETE